MMADDGGNPAGMGCSCGPEMRHIPVLLAEVLERLAPTPNGVFIDATFGAGGYSRAILERANCRVLALDRDPAAIAGGRPIAQHYHPRLTLALMRFGELDRAAREHGHEQVDGVVLDIGVSSMQLDQPERGFSFRADGPLDMRMFAGATGDSEDKPTAADLLNTLSQAQLADVIYHYGEERRARAIAAAIVRARGQRALARTGELAEICERAYGRRAKDAIHPATRTFQALRIAVNDELGELAHGLAAAERILKPGGRLVVVTFHSLEDRIVKRFFASRSGRTAGGSRHRPELIQFDTPSFRNVNQRPLGPDNQEIAANPRARSAKLRAGLRTEAPAWPLDTAALGLPDLDIR